MKKIMSRSEELALLAVVRLGEEAYSVQIREELARLSGKRWSFGAVYDPLDRLEKNGLLESFLTDPIPERGGRSKRIYRLTRRGKQALLEIRELQRAFWSGVPLSELEETS
jgi:DNA-binding PadR family transcriptional regulator